MDALHARWQLGVQRIVKRADVLVEVTDEIPAEIGGFVELLQGIGGIDAAADDLGIDGLELVAV
jgi:hypothetical protein